jgi:hypothetical protein
VGQGITQGQVTRDPGIADLETRQVSFERFVPIHLAVVHHHSHRDGREELGHRPMENQGRGIDRCRVAHLAHPKAARETTESSLTTAIARPATLHCARL